MAGQVGGWTRVGLDGFRWEYSEGSTASRMAADVAPCLSPHLAHPLPHPTLSCSLIPDLASTCPDAAKRAELLAVHRDAFTPDGKAKVSWTGGLIGRELSWMQQGGWVG